MQNSIGETSQSILVSVVTVPRLEEEHKVKAGSELALPCVQGGEWARAGQTVRGGGDIILDRETGNLVILSMTEAMEGEYSCRVVIPETGEERVIRTLVSLGVSIIVSIIMIIIIIITGEHHAGYCAHQE